MKNLRFGIVAVALLVTSPNPVQAQFSTSWGAATFSCFNSQQTCTAGSSYIWHAGDYWELVVAGTGLPSASGFGYFFDVNVNTTQDFILDFFLNGTFVGSRNFGTGPDGSTTFTGFFGAFAPVLANAGTSYTARFEVNTELCSGCGSFGINSFSGSTLDLDGRQLWR